jgi:acyl dehydratase
MSHRTFAALAEGAVVDCGTWTVSREAILAFGREHDPLAIHTDPDAAAASAFGGLIASGIHTFALTQPPVVDRLYADSDMIASRGIDDLRFPAPVRPGDTLHVSVEIEDKRSAPDDPERGYLTTHRRATVDDEPVLSLRNHTVWRR